MNPPSDHQPETQSAAPAPSARTSRPVSGRPADLQPGHRLVTVTLADERMWAACEAFVYEMYVSIGYTESSPRHRVEELAAWADVSRFHAVVDEDDRVIGTVRTIFGSYAQLPVNQFERTDHRDPDPVCELSSLVVDPHQRSTGVIEHLYRAGWLDAWRAGSEALVALIDDWLFEAFQETYRLPFRQIGIGQHYMGSDPVPVSLPLQGHHYLDLARGNPQFWAWTLEAITAAEVRDWDLPIVLVDTADAPATDTRSSAARRTN
ncbi:MAG: Acetyltransferase family protein [Acidimicrobiales bacterium]|nr:Acetyltransferase family protein [Acidimicrobiales bacterium]